MAIYIQEEKGNGGGWFGFGILFVSLAIVGVAAYYLFFVKPDLINTVAPIQLQSIDELARIQFDPKEVVSGQFFSNLSQFVQPPNPAPAGNSTPFGTF